MIGIVDEVASRTEATVLVLVVVATHLLAEGGLDKLFQSVCKEAALPVYTVSALRKAPAQLHLTFRTRLRHGLIANLAHQYL